MRCEGVSVLAVDVLGLVVVVAHRIANLYTPSAHHVLHSISTLDLVHDLQFLLAESTYVHVHRLSIAAVSVQISRHNDQLFLSNKVPDAALVLGRLVAVYGVEVEFEGCGEGSQQNKQLKEAE